MSEDFIALTTRVNDQINIILPRNCCSLSQRASLDNFTYIEVFEMYLHERLHVDTYCEVKFRVTFLEMNRDMGCQKQREVQICCVQVKQEG